MAKAKRTAKKPNRSKSRPSILKRFLLSVFSNRRRSSFVIVALFAVVGTVILVQSQATTCGARVSNYAYKVPFGKAVWNQPVCNLPVHPQSADYANRFYTYSNLNDGSPKAALNKGKVGTGVVFPKPLLTDPEGLSSLFSRNVYYASKATGTIKVQTSVYPSNLDGTKYELSGDQDRRKYTPDTPIPWNPEWRTGEAGDNEIVIIDDVSGQGRIYGIAGYKRGIFHASQCGLFFLDRLCAYEVNVGRDSDGNIFDYRTFEGQTGDRGVGLSYYATLVTPEEVQAGEIRHAMGLAIPNTAIGPVCSKTQLGTADEGKACGTAVAPASKFEWSGNRVPQNISKDLHSIYTQDKLIPEGMRFAIKQDTDIEAWIRSRPDLVANKRKADTARVFAQALKDYGMIVADTSGAGAGIQTAGAVNPDTRKQWESLGLTSDKDEDLLDGLITSSNLYVIDTPTLTCKDGSKSKYYCDWTKAAYTASSSSETIPQQSIPPTVNITSPVANAPASGPVDIAASVSGPNPITNVQFIVGGNPLATDNTAPYTYRFDSKALTNGTNTITVKATDSKGLSDSKSVNINVNNPVATSQTDTTPPTPPAALARSLRPDFTKVRYVLDLTWKASTDASGIREYQVTRLGGKVPFAKVTKETKLTDDTIEAGIQYSYSVVAIDNTGRKSLPSSVSAKGNCFLIWCSLE